MPLAIKYPAWLKPEIIPGLPVRWYGLMYIVAFSIAFVMYRKQVRERNFPMTDDQLSSLFFWGILGLLLGARIFATIVYETSDIYIRRPWLIFWPFRNGNFTGLQGMSYHGGVIGCALGFLLWSVVHRFQVREIGDMFGASVPLGYTFGRIGNFINAELYGRVTTGPLGMIFPDAATFPASLDWVREAAKKTGIPIPASPSGASPDVNLPRYPTQLFEAFFEGVFLWFICWSLRNKKPFKGFICALYLLGYGVIRFVIEYFREADNDLGYRIELVPNDLPLALAHPLTSFSTGQIFSAGMMLAAIVLMIAASRFPDRKPLIKYPVNPAPNPIGVTAPEKTADEKKSDRNSRRRLRKKLR
ncbi:MAG: prolipoprotein diacylglyceryl transferase [Spirochaetaceae bacterium]|nr:prolipoprotein diacylglyceryl transferase [Spirochaetaceae bacterium]